VESGAKEDVFSAPRHPYTKALLSATPKTDPTARGTRIKLTGELPSPMDVPKGCAFAPRCWKAQDICRAARPDLTTDAHPAACFFPEEGAPSPAAGKA
jgi:dipeptide transport system ATP-binding protein